MRDWVVAARTRGIGQFVFFGVSYVVTNYVGLIVH